MNFPFGFISSAGTHPNVPHSPPTTTTLRPLRAMLAHWANIDSDSFAPPTAVPLDSTQLNPSIPSALPAHQPPATVNPEATLDEGAQTEVPPTTTIPSVLSALAPLGEEGSIAESMPLMPVSDVLDDNSFTVKVAVPNPSLWHSTVMDWCDATAAAPSTASPKSRPPNIPTCPNQQNEALAAALTPKRAAIPSILSVLPLFEESSITSMMDDDSLAVKVAVPNPALWHSTVMDWCDATAAAPSTASPKSKPPWEERGPGSAPFPPSAVPPRLPHLAHVEARPPLPASSNDSAIRPLYQEESSDAASMFQLPFSDILDNGPMPLAFTEVAASTTAAPASAPRRVEVKLPSSVLRLTAPLNQARHPEVPADHSMVLGLNDGSEVVATSSLSPFDEQVMRALVARFGHDTIRTFINNVAPAQTPTSVPPLLSAVHLNQGVMGQSGLQTPPTSVPLPDAKLRSQHRTRQYLPTGTKRDRDV